VVIWSPLSDRLSRYELARGDVGGLVRLIGRALEALARAGAGSVRALSCYEAGYDGFWLHRLLVGEGIENSVIDPASLLVNRRRRRAKTDRLDGEDMVLALMAYHRGDPRALRVVTVPSPEEEDARRPGRERERLVRERVQHENRVRGLLALHGVVGVFPRKTAVLEELRTPLGQPLPLLLVAELRRELERLAVVKRQLGVVEAGRRAALREATPGAERVRRLMRVRGIGPETAHVLAHEMFTRRFANRRQVAAAAGLDPTPHASGSLVREQGIAKAGNRRVRTAMVEVAWLWVRYQPESALSVWFRERAQGGSRARRVLIVALARKLLVALWRYLETGQVPEGAVLKS
jgi:transposase